MKSTSLLRVLSLLGFLLLMTPFYDQCNGNGMIRQQHKAEISESDAKDSIPVQKTEFKEEVVLNFERDSFLTRVFDFIDDEETLNAYELVEYLPVYYDISFTDFKNEIADDFKKNTYDTLSYLIRSVAFLLIIVFTVFQFISSMLKRYRWLYKSTILNIVWLFVAIICIVFFDSMFETFRQIKWGLYSFLLVQMALVYLSKRQLRSIPN